MKPVINRADIIGGLKSVKLAKINPQNYQPGIGVSEDFLDQRLEDVKNFGKLSKQSIEVFEKTKRKLGSIITKKYR